MNYQEFIKNIYTSLKSINLKQQKLEEHFQTTFQKIDDLDDKVNKVSNKLDDFIDASNRLKEQKQIELSNSLNNITQNLENIQIEQDDIITTMTDVSNIEENMSVLLDDFLSSEQIINNEINMDLPLDNIQIDREDELKGETREEPREETREENNKEDKVEKNGDIREGNIEEDSGEQNTVLQSLDLSNEPEDKLLILE